MARPKLTKAQREALELLRDSEGAVVDRHGIAWIGNREIYPTVWAALLKVGYVVTPDTNAPATARYLISDAGRAELDAGPTRRRPAPHSGNAGQLDNDKPTEGQLEFAVKLGLRVTPKMTRTELSELIDFTREGDEPASEAERQLAARYGIRFTRYLGKRLLHERIFRGLDRPDRDAKLVAWFGRFVYLDLAGEEPSIEALEKAVAPLAADASILSSIRRAYIPSLFRFGKYTDDEGLWNEGASRRTIAYKRIAEALVEKLGVPPRPTRADPTPAQPTRNRADVATPTGGGCLSVVACVALFAAVVAVLT